MIRKIVLQMTEFVFFISIDFRPLIIDFRSQPSNCFLYQSLTIGTRRLHYFFLRRYNAVTDLLKYDIAH